MPTLDICFMTATELARRIRAKELSARDTMAAHLQHIERLNPRVNAIVTLVAEEAITQASIGAKGDYLERVRRAAFDSPK